VFSLQSRSVFAALRGHFRSIFAALKSQFRDILVRFRSILKAFSSHFEALLDNFEAAAKPDSKDGSSSTNISPEPSAKAARRPSAERYVFVPGSNPGFGTAEQPAEKCKIGLGKGGLSSFALADC
jgi:hypothetical protein